MNVKNEKWSESAWEKITPIYDRILKLPFITELTAGDLSGEKFMNYMVQDSLYLKSYVQVLSHISSRLTDESSRRRLLEFALDGIEVEKAVHEEYLEGKEAERSDQSLTCLLYTSFLKSQAYSPVEVEMASVIPCFWVYQRVGEEILKRADTETNPYGKWILTYADPQFARATKDALSICDRLAAETTDEVRQMMTEAFILGTKMELLFWESAYKLEEKTDILTC